MPLVDQQDIVVITGPYQLASRDQRTQEAAVAKLKHVLESYPPCRIVSITAGEGTMHAYCLTAVIETV